MRSFGTVLVGGFLVGMLMLGVWAYQRFPQDQGANRLEKQSESTIALFPNGNNTIDADSKNWTLETTIGKIVADRPEAARVLELVGIDYCCGGRTSLAEAADAQNADPSQLLRALLVVGTASTGNEYRDWQQAEIGELIDHLVSTHHAWLRRELPALKEVTETVLRVHGDSHAELADVAATLERIRAAVLPHLDEEEQHLFPALRGLAKGEVPTDIDKQLVSMRTDHDSLGEDLHRLRELTDGFAVPTDACAKYREMLSGLTALECDMHQHVHLENNVLLPKAQNLLSK